MLHIKDIEAFAHINEALNEDTGTDRQADQASGDNAGQHTSKPAHPALVMAMLATGRLPLSALSKSPTKPKAADPLAPRDKPLRRS